MSAEMSATNGMQVRRFNDHKKPQAFDSTVNDAMKDLLARVRQQNMKDETVYSGYLGLVLVSYIMRSMGFILDQFDIYRRPLLTRSITFLAGSGGYFAMEAVLTHGATGLQDLLVCGQQAHALPESDCELFHGRAGYLHSLLFVRRQLGNAHFAHDIVTSLVQQIVTEGMKNGPNGVLLWVCHNRPYLGATHGLAGILYVLLHCQLSETYQHILLIERTADWLIDHCRNPSGSFLAVADDAQPADVMGFCYGAAGFIPLLCSLTQRFPAKAKHYRAVAEEVGALVWQRGLQQTKAPGLCHGIAGSICALLDLHRLTKKKRWLYRAQHFCVHAVQHLDPLLAHTKHPQSLFEGATGVLFALAATLRPDLLPSGSCFPGLGFI